jgi:hypothetical protein
MRVGAARASVVRAAGVKTAVAMAVARVAAITAVEWAAEVGRRWRGRLWGGWWLEWREV